MDHFSKKAPAEDEAMMFPCMKAAQLSYTNCINKIE